MYNELYLFKSLNFKKNELIMGIGDWGLGIWAWGLGVWVLVLGPNPQTPNPQSPIPNPHLSFSFI